MDGTIRRLDRTSLPDVARLSPDDVPAAAYVPMNIYNRVAIGRSLSQTGSDVIDEFTTVGDNIYEPLNDVSSFDQDEE